MSEAAFTFLIILIFLSGPKMRMENRPGSDETKGALLMRGKVLITFP